MSRTKKLIALSVALSIFATVAVLYFTFSEETLEALKEMKVEFLLLSLLIHIAALFVWSLRIKVLSRTLGFHVELRRAIEIVTSSIFMAAITPSHAGGEPVRVALLTRCGLSPGDSSAVVLGERVLDGIFLSFLAVFSLFYLQKHLQSHTHLRVVAIVSLLLIIGSIGFLILSVANPRAPERAKRISKKLMDRFEWLRKREVIVERILEEILNFRNAMIVLIRRKNHGTVFALALTAIFWSLEFSIPSIIILGVGEPGDFLLSYFIQAVLTIILMLPLTPGSSGVAEIGSATFYSILLPPYKLGIFVVVWRFVTYHFNLILGSLMALKVLRSLKKWGKSS